MSVRETHYVGYGVMFEDYHGFKERFGNNPDDPEDEDSRHLDKYRQKGEKLRLVEDGMGIKFVFVGVILEEAHADQGEGLGRTRIPGIHTMLTEEYIEAMRVFGLEAGEAAENSHFYVFTHYH